jgi:hypothetical protein
MFIMSEVQFRHKLEEIKQYYSSGYLRFSDIVAQLEDQEVRRFEKDPINVWKDGKLIKDNADFQGAKDALLKNLCQKYSEEKICYLEFGVRTGRSMNIVCSSLEHPGAQLYGFDTFEGLPEGWVPAWGNSGKIGNARPPGSMKVTIPSIKDARVHLFRGLFQHTLPSCLGIVPRLPKIINIDSDTYTAALYCLSSLDPFLRHGDIVYFDEFADTINEFAAFSDYVRSFYRRDDFRLIGSAYDAFAFEFVGKERPLLLDEFASKDALKSVRTTSLPNRFRACRWGLGWTALRLSTLQCSPCF